jgi:hypothetical protein
MAELEVALTTLAQLLKRAVDDVRRPLCGPIQSLTAIIGLLDCRLISLKRLLNALVYLLLRHACSY